MKTLRFALLLWLLCHGPVAQALCVGPLCSCTVSTNNVVFGSFNPLAIGSTDSTGSVRVTCGGVVGLLIPYQIELGPGASGSTTARRLSSGPNTLDYGLYSNPSRTTNWGSIASGTAVSGSVSLNVLGSAAPVTHTVYGRIPGGQGLAVPGAYADTITVTLTYY